MAQPRWWAPAVAALIMAFVVLAFLGVRGQDPTTDERGYFGLGKHLLLTRDWSTRRAILHPPLSAYVGALPLLAAPGTYSTPVEPEPWLLLQSRLASLLAFGVPLLIVVALWARDLFGPAASLAALALAAFSPTLLAHSALITPDVPLAATGLATVYVFQRARGRSAPAAWGALLGLTLLAKGSGWIFVGAILALGAVRVARGGGRRAAGDLLIGGAVALLVLNLAYGFQGLFDIDGKRRLLAKIPSAAQRALGWAAAPWFPLPYLHSLGAQLSVNNRGWTAYLWGRVSQGGWWYYYLAALALKETVPALVTLGAAAARWWRTRRPLPDELALLVPAAFVIAAFSVGRVQIGVRYVLPALPFLYVFASRLWAPGSPRALRAAGAALLCWHAVEPVRISPEYLAYFNQLVGGPARGYLYLGDSNLDWGQNARRALAFAQREGAVLEPAVLPAHGRVLVSGSRLQGIIDRAPYRRLREEYAPVGHVGYNWLLYDLDRPRVPPSSIVSLSSGPAWQAAGGGAEESWMAPALSGSAAGFVAATEYPGTDAQVMTCAPPSASCVFRRSFGLERPPPRAVLHLAARERWRVEVNGRRIAERTSCTPVFARTEVWLDGGLRAGQNAITVATASCSADPVSGIMVELRLAQGPR